MKKSGLSVVFFLFSVLGCCSLAAAQDQPDADFDSFLKKFTSSAEFQCSRVKFPLATPIFVIDENENEKEMPFTEAEWPLLTAKELEVCKINTTDGVYFGRFAVKDKDHVEFEAGLEESELDLSITFDLIDGKWYVTDCYNGLAYGSVSASEFDATVYEVQQKNEEFIKKHP